MDWCKDRLLLFEIFFIILLLELPWSLGGFLPHMTFHRITTFFPYRVGLYQLHFLCPFTLGESSVFC